MAWYFAQSAYISDIHRSPHFSPSAHRLGNRSALEWVIDQYRVKTDKRSGIVNDPNRAADPQYILRLLGKVISVSLETVNIVESLPGLGIEEELGATQE